MVFCAELEVVVRILAYLVERIDRYGGPTFFSAEFYDLRFVAALGDDDVHLLNLFLSRVGHEMHFIVHTYSFGAEFVARLV